MTERKVDGRAVLIGAVMSALSLLVLWAILLAMLLSEKASRSGQCHLVVGPHPANCQEPAGKNKNLTTEPGSSLPNQSVSKPVPNDEPQTGGSQSSNLQTSVVEKIITAADNGKVVDVPAGQHAVFELEGDIRGGFEWVVVSATSGLSQKGDVIYSDRSFVTGHSNIFTARFRCLKPGAAAVTLQYRDYRNPGRAPLKTVIVQIRIVP